jgi:hypothetical protein
VSIESIRKKFMSFTRSIISSVSMFVIICGLSLAQQAGKSNSKPEDQVTQLERDWLAADAKNDTAALRQLISDDFMGSSFNGGLLNKGDIIPEAPDPAASPAQLRAKPMCDSLATLPCSWASSTLAARSRSPFT